MIQDAPLENVITFLLDTPMFEHLDEHELSIIVHILELLHLPEKEVLFRAGDTANAWYVVYQGGIEITHLGVGGTRVLSRLGPRGCFGEMAVLDGSVRSAKVRATQDSVLLRIPRPAFNSLLRDGELAAYKLVHRMALILAARVRGMNAENAIGAGPAPIDLTDVDEPTEQ